MADDEVLGSEMSPGLPVASMDVPSQISTADTVLSARSIDWLPTDAVISEVYSYSADDIPSEPILSDDYIATHPFTGDGDVFNVMSACSKIDADEYVATNPDWDFDIDDLEFTGISDVESTIEPTGDDDELLLASTDFMVEVDDDDDIIDIIPDDDLTDFSTVITRSPTANSLVSAPVETISETIGTDSFCSDFSEFQELLNETPRDAIPLPPGKTVLSNKDAFEALRDLESEMIEYEGERWILFGDTCVHSKALSGWFSKKRRVAYDLGSLWWFIEGIRGRAHVDRANTERIGYTFIDLKDRSALMKRLFEEKNDEVPTPTPVQPLEPEPTSTAQAPGSPVSVGEVDTVSRYEAPIMSPRSVTSRKRARSPAESVARSVGRSVARSEISVAPSHASSAAVSTLMDTPMEVDAESALDLDLPMDLASADVPIHGGVTSPVESAGPATPVDLPMSPGPPSPAPSFPDIAPVIDVTPKPSPAPSFPDIAPVIDETPKPMRNFEEEMARCQAKFEALTWSLKATDMRTPLWRGPHVGDILQLARSTLKTWSEDERRRNAKTDQRRRRVGEESSAQASSAEFSTIMRHAIQPPKAAEGTRLQQLIQLTRGCDERNPPVAIIVLPNNRSSNLNMLNVQAFFNECRFEKLSSASTTQNWCNRKRRFGYLRRVRNIPVRFEFADDTKQFKKDSWMKVVGVVVDGQEWQFKDWPFKSHVDLFTAIQGYHINYVGDPKPGVLSKWNLLALNVQKLSRHEDPVVVDLFWRQMDDFLMQRSKTNLMSLESKLRI